MCGIVLKQSRIFGLRPPDAFSRTHEGLHCRGEASTRDCPYEALVIGYQRTPQDTCGRQVKSIVNGVVEVGCNSERWREEGTGRIESDLPAGGERLND